MDRQNAIEYISHVDWRHSRLGLERITELMRRLGDPQDKLKFVHVAGTNGKGSVSSMLAGVLGAAGYTTGLYTSPYIHHFNERMQVNGVEITDREVGELTEYVRRFAEEMDDHPTEFELITAIGLEWFSRKGCDIVVLEVGLGGRLDATNVIGIPELAVITTIDMDHTAELGDTLPQIAAEKAGIIKPGGDVVLYPQPPEVEAVFEAACRERGAKLMKVDFSTLEAQRQTLAGQVFRYHGMDGLDVPLLGPYQLRNAAVVVTSVEALRGKGWRIPEEAVREGLAKVRWPARFEMVNAHPPVILDGGHNVQGVAALVNGIARYFPGQKAIFVCGVMADKDYATMFRMVVPLAKRIYCVTPDNSRALPAEELMAFLNKEGFNDTVACASVGDGLREAVAAAGEADVVCVFGSFYMAGEVRAFFGKD